MEVDSTSFVSTPDRTNTTIAWVIVSVTILIVLFIIGINFLINKQIAATTNSCTSPPNPPTNISFTKISANQFNISWTVAPNASSYKIYVGTSNGFQRNQAILVKAIDVPPAAITNLQTNNTYYVFITSLNSCGESVNSEQASFFFTFP